MIYINKESDILKNMMLFEGTNYPNEIIKNKRNNKNFIEVPFVIDVNNGIYTWIYIKLIPYNYHYRGLVNEIISLKYDESEMFAILLNYMDDPKNEVYKNEYEELQNWRKHAKEFAKKHFGI